MKKEFLEAYQNLKNDIQKVSKNKEGFGYNYADLEAVKESADKALKDNGFLFVTYVQRGDGFYHRKNTFFTKSRVNEKVENQEILEIEAPIYEMSCHLIHKDIEEELVSDIPLYTDDIDPQAIGSSMTYMRRYGLLVMLDIITIDDDGISASRKGKVNKNSQKKSLPENILEWAKFLEAQSDPKAYYYDIKNSNVPYDIKRQCNNIMYPKKSENEGEK